MLWALAGAMLTGLAQGAMIALVLILVLLLKPAGLLGKAGIEKV